MTNSDHDRRAAVRRRYEVFVNYWCSTNLDETEMLVALEKLIDAECLAALPKTYNTEHTMDDWKAGWNAAIEAAKAEIAGKEAE